MEIIERDLPQLIVGLDSLDDSANYIHISDVKESTNYYCPCCKGLIKPRAYKKDVDYQVQPHFYHETGGCSEETYIHYICKNWLFEKGCKFIINSIEYEVNHVEVEKTLHTSFGDYRPDIIVTTTIGKTFYFEIKVSNKKTELYAPKWDELDNDVVEVDTRYFINQKYKNDIPEFKLIYSDGECFIKSYSRMDYEDTIAKRKLEWKRQDKLNYKIQWERLDWFWQSLINYKENNENVSEVINSFKKLSFDDMDFVISIVKKMKCQDLYQSLIPVINNAFYEIIKTYDISPYEKVELIQESPRIFYIAFQICNIENCFWYNSCFVNRKVEYYGNEILKVFLNFINSATFKNFGETQCPCLLKVKEYKYKNVLTNENVNFYLNERCAIYWNHRNNRYHRTFSSLKCIDIYSDMRGYASLYNVLAIKYPQRTLTKSEHMSRIHKNDEENKNILNTKLIIQKINNCRNGYWKAYLSSDTKTIHIILRIGDFYNSYHLNISKSNSLQEIFKNVKIRMNILLDRAKVGCFSERVMEVK